MTASLSWNIRNGAGRPRCAWPIASHAVLRLLRSHCNSSVERPTPAVRTMAPMPSGTDQPVHGLAHLIAILAFDAARHAAGARVVRHQHQEASGQADEGGERRALVAALLLLDLDDELLALLQQILDVEPSARRGCVRKYSLETSLSGRKPWRWAPYSTNAASRLGSTRVIRPL